MRVQYAWSCKGGGGGLVDQSQCKVKTGFTVTDFRPTLFEQIHSYMVREFQVKSRRRLV